MDPWHRAAPSVGKARAKMETLKECLALREPPAILCLRRVQGGEEVAVGNALPAECIATGAVSYSYPVASIAGHDILSRTPDHKMGAKKKKKSAHAK